MQSMDMFAAAGAGLLFGLSLVVAIGPQNVFVLRQAVGRTHVALVVSVCSASDIALIAGGVGGAGAVLDGRHWLLTASTLAGAGFLLGYGGMAARRAVRPVPIIGGEPRRSRDEWRAVLITCLAFTWLNPSVYVDTVFLVAPVSRTHAPAQWWFAVGAMMASVGWFVGLGYGARFLGRLFARPGGWRVVDGVVACVMVVTAARLVLDL